MRALTWHGKHDVRVETVPDPEIINPRDIVIKVTSTAICGSDLHIYDSFIPSMHRGDVLGHEFMGEVVEVGSENKKLKVGDRVTVRVMSVVPSRYWAPESTRNRSPGASARSVARVTRSLLTERLPSRAALAAPRRQAVSSP